MPQIESSRSADTLGFRPSTPCRRREGDTAPCGGNSDDDGDMPADGLGAGCRRSVRHGPHPRIRGPARGGEGAARVRLLRAGAAVAGNHLLLHPPLLRRQRLLPVGHLRRAHRWRPPDLAAVFHYGSISLIAEPCRTVHLHAMKVAKEAGALLSYDPNLREALWPSLEEARTKILSIWDQADIVKVSELELKDTTAAAAARQGIQGHGSCF